jgi:hypothetical protein
MTDPSRPNRSIDVALEGPLRVTLNARFRMRNPPPTTPRVRFASYKNEPRTLRVPSRVPNASKHMRLSLHLPMLESLFVSDIATFERGLSDYYR